VFHQAKTPVEWIDQPIRNMLAEMPDAKNKYAMRKVEQAELGLGGMLTLARGMVENTIRLPRPVGGRPN